MTLQTNRSDSIQIRSRPGRDFCVVIEPLITIHYFVLMHLLG